MSLAAGIAAPGFASTDAARGQLPLRIAVFCCGCSSAFSLDLLGQLFWAEMLLPVLAIIVLAMRFPAALFQNRAFQLLMGSIVMMFVGYVVSDLIAGTPSEMYMRGWARVIAFGSSAFSLCVVCHADRRCLLWFCIGMGAGGCAAGWLAGMPLTRWKLGYGENAALLVTASAAMLPLWLASIAIALLGGVSVLLDYRSLGVLLMLVAVATFLRGARVDLRRLWRSLPLLLLLLGAVAGAATWLLKASADEYQSRRSVSTTSRLAALRIGAIAIADSPLIGYGSWGQGTEKYGAMLYEDVVDDLMAEDPDMLLTRGGVFSAHSQLIQAWMEGGLLAAVFFIAYIVLLVRRLFQCVYQRAADKLMPLVLLILASNLWAALMSPFLGSQRTSIALAVAAIVLLAAERPAEEGAVAPRQAEPLRPANLMP